MKIKILIWGFLFLFLIACEKENEWSTLPGLPEPEETPIANVIMFEGPIYEDGNLIFTYKGVVKNVGNKLAEYVKIYIYIRKSDSSLITYDYMYADDPHLNPGETSPWSLIFWDDDKKIRNQMDKSKMTYEIKWD